MDIRGMAFICDTILLLFRSCLALYRSACWLCRLFTSDCLLNFQLNRSAPLL